MSRLLNVGLIQMSLAQDFETNLKEIEKHVKVLMKGIKKPDIILGVEMGISSERGNTIPGKETDILGAIAKKHGIYFIPGSMTETVIENGEPRYYNATPIFGPDGQMIDVHRKMCPYYPAEEYHAMGERYVVFEIKEKNIKFGVLNCHEWCFPEVSRNLMLMGAEVLYRLAVDPEGLYENCQHISNTRAFENQAYFISMNAVGFCQGVGYAYGKSKVAGPDGITIYEGPGSPTCVCLTLDLDAVENARKYGTNYTEQLVRQLKLFNIPMPYKDDISKAPVFNGLPDADVSLKACKDASK